MLLNCAIMADPVLPPCWGGKRITVAILRLGSSSATIALSAAIASAVIPICRFRLNATRRTGSSELEMA
jgi:hypothetical protein